MFRRSFCTFWDWVKMWTPGVIGVWQEATTRRGPSAAGATSTEQTRQAP
jgi:hypothetical protein